MTKPFVTLEDVNGALFDNQNCYWHEIDLTNIPDDHNFTNVKIDFCEISRTTAASLGEYEYTFKINNSYWANGFYGLKNGEGVHFLSVSVSNNTLKVVTNSTGFKLFLYMGWVKYDGYVIIRYILNKEVLYLNYKELESPQNFLAIPIGGGIVDVVSQVLEVGYNLIKNGGYYCGFVLVKLLKTDFQFNCTQSLTLGKVNTVKLGALTDYKLNGDMIGSNVPNITVKYGDIYIPVTFDSTVNDYVFELDLTDKQNEGKVRFNVLIEANDVINATETEVTLNSSFETINNESKLITLFKNGGIGRLGANITLTTDLTLNKDVLIIGNAKTINMANHKFIVPSEKTFKTENTIFTNGKNTIQQNIGSTVELTSCGFSGCTGFGSVIDCQTDLSSLSIENDFITNITNCVFVNNDMCILHGGQLNITGCEVTGKISNPNNPYFLYQTDGEATILQSTFNLSSDTQIEEDIEFNSCIFVCGESATLNGNNHDELQQNNVDSFISNPQNNRSTINVTYYYPAIEDYITLQSDKGYCHSCSNVDFVFKTNVTARRE